MDYEIDLKKVLDDNLKKGVEGFTDIQNLMLNMMGGLQYEDLTPQEKEMYDREIGQK